MEPVLCRYLDWDSEFFGRRIARLAAARLTVETVVEAERWCASEGIDCLYFLSDLDDPLTSCVAQEHRFTPVDVRVTLEARVSPLSPPAAPGHIRRFREEDASALAALAQVGHRDSRFYFDPGFPDDACDRLYQTWIDKSCRGWADAVLVADTGSGAVGYATAHRDGEEGRLGLLGVDERARGRGLGMQLVEAVLVWARRENLQTVSVVTQGRNCRAMRLYSRCGFLPRPLQLWYHRWFSLPQPGSVV